MKYILFLSFYLIYFDITVFNRGAKVTEEFQQIQSLFGTGENSKHDLLSQ